MLGEAVIIGKDRKLAYTGLSITGIQQDTFLSFTIKQEFANYTGYNADVIYFLPSEPYLCTYDLTFIVDEKIIKPTLRRKEEVMKEMKKLLLPTNEEYLKTFGQFSGNGLESFGLGNIEL